MAICRFAIRQIVGYDGGAYTGGPFRVVLHTTEGPTAASALSIFHSHYAPHFVVDPLTIYQLIDTDRAACALEHHGDPQTNRLSAVQIEMVGYAGKDKSMAMLANVRRLLRWIEATHDVPRDWPMGPAHPAIDGKDPGHHIRDPHIWTTHGGYYEHSEVPNNSHWDAGLTEEERKFLMASDASA